jgi:hypothetical protein
MSEDSAEMNFSPAGPPDLPRPSTKEQRLANWRTMDAYFRTNTASLGELDNGVRDPVIALHLLGVTTAQSCEGHLDHGTAAPWIILQAKETNELIALERSEPDRYLSEVQRLNGEEVRKANELIEAFYGKREVSDDRRLTIHVLSDNSGILGVAGAAHQTHADAGKRQQKLAEYQSEMTEFSKFLKKKYFEE